MTEEKKNTVEDNQVNGTADADTQTANVNQNEEETNNTKKEETVEEKAQKIADAIVAKKMKGMPSKEELKGYKDWQESKKTAEQKQRELDEEHTKTKDNLAQAEKKILVLEADVKKKNVGYVVYEVSQMEGEFEDNLKTFLKENPEYLRESQTQTSNKATGGNAKGGANTSSSGIDAILKQRHPDLF